MHAYRNNKNNEAKSGTMLPRKSKTVFDLGVRHY